MVWKYRRMWEHLLSGFSVIMCVLFNSYVERIKENKRLCLIILENRLTRTVFVQWGKVGDKQHGYGDHIPLEPNHAISRDCRYSHSQYYNRPCARVSQERDSTEKNVTIILGETSDSCHTKLYQISEEGITEYLNPTERNWHAGELKIYQTPDKS